MCICNVSSSRRVAYRLVSSGVRLSQSLSIGCPSYTTYARKSLFNFVLLLSNPHHQMRQP